MRCGGCRGVEVVVGGIRKAGVRGKAGKSSTRFGDLVEFHVVDELGGGGRPERVLALRQAFFTL